MCKCCIERAASGSLVRNFRCVVCCADAVRSHRPSRAMQEHELWQLTALRGAPTRDAVLEELRKA